MKIIVVAVTIFIVLVVAPTSASFFDEFHGAISSVHDSFGRLFTDVVSDVSETIGCTVLAVKQVLALDGSYHESSDYNTRCKGVKARKDSIEGQPQFNLGERDAVGEIESIEAQLKRQTDRLWEISDLLRHEIDNIPSDIKIKFGVRDPDPSESVVGRIWNDLKFLHDIEHSNEENDPQVTEIHHVLDKALSIMRMNSTNSNESDDDKIKSLFRGIEKESNDTTIEIDEQFTKWEKQESMEKQHTNSSLIKEESAHLRIENDVKEIIEDLKEDGIGSIEVGSLITTVNEINYDVTDSNTDSSISSEEYENNDSSEITVKPSTTPVALTTATTTTAALSTSTTVSTTTTTTVAPTTRVTPTTTTVAPSTSTPVSTTTTTTVATTTSVKPTTTTVAPSTSTPVSTTTTTTVATTTSVTPTTTTVAPSTCTPVSTATTATVAPTTSVTSTTTTVAPSTSTPVTTPTTTTVAPTTSVTPITATVAPITSTTMSTISTTTVSPTTSVTPTTITVAPSTSTTVSTTTTATVAPITSVRPTTSTTTTVASTTSATPTTPDDPEFQQFQMYVLSQMGPQDIQSQENTAAEAHKLITDSKYRNTIFHYIKKSSDTGTNVFDNPELFAF